MNEDELGYARANRFGLAAAWTCENLEAAIGRMLNCLSLRRVQTCLAARVEALS